MAEKLMGLQVDDLVRTKVTIIDYGDGCYPDQVVAYPGTVLQISKIGDQNPDCIWVRHKGVTDHMGFALQRGEYERTACECEKVARKDPCWTVPVRIMSFNDNRCSVCGHADKCHTHTDRFEKFTG